MQRPHVEGHASRTIWPLLYVSQYLVALGFGVCAIHAQSFVSPMSVSNVYVGSSLQQTPHEMGQLMCTSFFLHCTTCRKFLFLTHLHVFSGSLSVKKLSLLTQKIVGPNVVEGKVVGVKEGGEVVGVKDGAEVVGNKEGGEVVGDEVVGQVLGIPLGTLDTLGKLDGVLEG